MKHLITRVTKHTKRIRQHFSTHKHKYLFGTFGTFAIVKSILLLAGFFGILNIANIFAAEIELNSGNIVTEYGCATDATICYISNTGITSIATDTFVNHTSLQELYLTCNQITSIESGDFNGLSSLTTLDLEFNQITSIESGDFNGLSSLTTLYLHYNQIASINLSGFASLTILTLNSNQLTTLGEEIMTLTNLQDSMGLNIYYNKIDYTDFSPELLAFIDQKHDIMEGDWRTTQTLEPTSMCTDISQTECDALVNFYYSTNGDAWSNNSGWLQTGNVCGVWYGVSCDGSGVQQIDLSSNLLFGSAYHLSELSNLQFVYFDDNQLTSINLTGLTNLIYIYLNNNQLTEIIGLESLDTTQGGDISWNNLPEIYITDNEQFFIDHGIQYDPQSNGDSMCTDISQTECDALVNFYYSTNGDAWSNNSGWLQTGNVCGVWYGVSCDGSGVQEINGLWNNLSGSALLSGLSNLQNLLLNNNNLTSIEFVGLSNLQNLNLDNNKITSIDIAELTSLQTLTLSNNELTSIDCSGLSNLQNLRFNNNNLTSIDLAGLSNLNLESLDLSTNLLTTLPESTTGLINLLFLGLDSNCRDTGLMSSELITFLDNKAGSSKWQSSFNAACPVPEHTVTFNVDMTNATFDPMLDNVYIAGSFTEWSEPGSNLEYRLSQVDASMIRSVTLQIPEGDIQYKYFINGWAGGERSGDPNRTGSINNDQTIDNVRGTLEGPVEDTDEDGIPDAIDNCPLVANRDQTVSAFQLFADDFDTGTLDNRSASWTWDSWDNPTGRYITGGKLTTIDANYRTIRFTDQSLVNQVFSIEADISDIPGSEARDVGKIRIQNPSGNGGIEWIDFYYMDARGTINLQISSGYETIYSTTIDPGLDPRTLRLEVNGNNYKGYMDDVLYMEYTDPIGYRDTMEAQFAGLYINNTIASFDNFALKIFDTYGDACNCTDDICTEGNDILGNPICDPDPACSTAVCGDNIIEGDEQCDGEYLPTSCENLGYDAGTLSCSPSCTFDTSSCSFFPVQLPDELDEFYTLYEYYTQKKRMDASIFAQNMINNNIFDVTQFPYHYYIGAIAKVNADRGQIGMYAQERMNTVLHRQGMLPLNNEIEFRNAVDYFEPMMLSGPVPNMSPFSGTIYNQGIIHICTPPTSGMCTDIPQAECDALVNFYYDTNGDTWATNQGWLQTGDVCDVWYGVSCDSSGVNQITLPWNNLSGSALLSGLSSLQILELGNNQLTSIDLSGLTNLQEIYLSNNQLTSIDLSGLTSLQNVDLGNNQLTSIDISGLTNLQRLYLQNNLLTEIIGLEEKIENIITEGDIRDNYLPLIYIQPNEQFFGEHNILYSPQNNDYIGDFSVTGLLFNQRPIYSGTLLSLVSVPMYQGAYGADAISYIGVPFDFSFNTLSFVDNVRGEATTVYGGPGDGCYADFVQGTGAYIPYIDTLLDTAMESSLDCSGYPETSCTMIIDPQRPPVSLDHSTEIVTSSGMTAWNRILVDVFTLMGQQPGQEQMLTIASGVQEMITQNMAPSFILSTICSALGTYDLNQCQMLGIFLGGDLGLSSVPNCGAKVYATTGYVAHDTTDTNTFFGRLPYTTEGFDIHMFVTSDNNNVRTRAGLNTKFGSKKNAGPESYFSSKAMKNETIDQDISNNMATVHIEISSGAGVSCINAGNFMETTHGDIEEIYVIDDDVCTSILGLCIEGDMYSMGQRSIVAIPDNVYYSNDSCTIPVLPTASDVHIIGNPTIGATLLGSYQYLYNLATWSQIGERFSQGRIISIDVENTIPYLIYDDGMKSRTYSVLMFSGDTWTQLGDSFPDGVISDLTVDNGVPYLMYQKYLDSSFSILMLSGDTWTQLGNSFTGGQTIEYLTVNDTVPYLIHWDGVDLFSVLTLSDGNWTQVGDSFPDGVISDLTVDNGVPYLIYAYLIYGEDGEAKNSKSVLMFSGDTWTQLGDSFSGDIKVTQLNVDNGTPYLIHWDNENIFSVLTLSDGNWTQLGDSFPDGVISDLTVDNGVPYLIYDDGMKNGMKSTTYSVLMFSGDTWTQVGGNFSEGQKIVYLTVDNDIPYIFTRYNDVDLSYGIHKEEGPSSYGIKEEGPSSYGIHMFSNQAQEEGPSSYQRYHNDDPIVGATNKSYTLTSQDAETTIFFEVTPKTSSLIGLPVRSTGLTIPASPIITPPQQPSGGGGGGSSLTKDICEGRDCSNSYYDGFCGPCNINEFEQQKIHGAAQEFLIQHKELFNQEVEKVRASTTKTYSDELLEAYTFAKDLGVTTIDTIDNANLEGSLIRSHMAKMISNFAVKVMQTPLNTGATCSFIDINNQPTDIQSYVQLACQLGLMGLEKDGITPMKTFRPNDVVTRAEFGTILSRLLRGTQYAGGTPYYQPHLNALKQANIMTGIANPAMQELRGWTMLMLMRVFEGQE